MYIDRIHSEKDNNIFIEGSIITFNNHNWN